MEKIKCNAAVTDGIGNFSIDCIEIEEPGFDEVLVKIRAAGICHTDYESLAWGKPLILGHEGAGTVAAVGRNVRGIGKGDAVILNWAIPCGRCGQCRMGNQNLCENNSPVTGKNNLGHAHYGATTLKGKNIDRSFNLGTLSEYTIVKKGAVVKNHSKNMSFAAASIIGCGVMTGYGSVVNAAKVKKGSTVVVIGAGSVGLNVIQAAKICSARLIIAVDVNKNRFPLAQKLGATHTVLAEIKDEGLREASKTIRELTDGRGADYAFECTAVPSLAASPLAMVRNAGTAVQVSGIEESITVDMNLFEWDKKYINPLYGKCRPQSDFPAIIDRYERKELFLEELVSKTYTLSQLSDAFEDMRRGKNAKGVIQF